MRRRRERKSRVSYFCRGVLSAAILTLAACSTTQDISKAVVRGTGPDANGFLIIGTANENSRNEMFFVSQAFGIDLARGDGQVEHVVRNGCNTASGILSGQSCSSDRRIVEHVVELPPGDWQIDGVFESDRHGFPSRTDIVRAKLPPGITIHVGPGEVVYAGDFLFTLDQDKVQGSLKSYSRDDAAAARALAAYPGLAGGFVYREPTHPVTGRS